MRQQKPYKEKSPINLKKLVAAGSEFVDNTYLIQMFEETRKTTQELINQLHDTIDEFEKQGGKYWTEEGQVYFQLKNSTLTLTHNEDGDDYYTADFSLRDHCIDLMYDTAIAVYKLPRMEFVLKTIPELVNYIENSDALEGGRDLQELIKKNDSLAVEIIKGAAALSEVE